MVEGLDVNIPGHSHAPRVYSECIADALSDAHKDTLPFMLRCETKAVVRGMSASDPLCVCNMLPATTFAGRQDSLKALLSLRFVLDPRKNIATSPACLTSLLCQGKSTSFRRIDTL